MPSQLDALPGLAKALEALKTYDDGQDRNLLQPIDAAVVATHGDAAARKDLEKRLAEVLTGNAPRDAMDYVCRVLRVIGTADSVSALAGLLAERNLSHMARYALQDNPAPEAAKALREALGTLNGALKVGVIGSLGVRRDTASVEALTALLAAADTMVAVAAAHALGTIGTPEAGQSLRQLAQNPPEGLQHAAADSCLLCAEALLAAGNSGEARLIYKSLTDPKQPKLVRLAATRGILAVVGKKD
ncbi:MAG: HEAT repeat domain-containing protein [Thermoguttaceae bacterium]